jgi:hypothetical protein
VPRDPAQGEATATKLRVLASREDRTVSALISNAISLYTDLPQELRLAWKQMQASDERGFQAFLCEVTAVCTENLILIYQVTESAKLAR